MQSKKAPSRWQWVLAMIPLPIVALVLVNWQLPTPRDAYVELSGTWQAVDVTEDGAAAHAEQLTGFRPVEVPGRFNKQGLDGKHVVMKRQVMLPAAFGDTSLTMTIGYVHHAMLTVWVNGHQVGTRGDLAHDFLPNDSELSTFLVAHDVARPGNNEVVIEVKSLEQARNGIIDRRTLIGRPEVLLPWAFSHGVLRSALSAGGVLLLLAMTLVLIALKRMHSTRLHDGVFWPTIGLMMSAAAYTMGRTGLLIAAHAPLEAVHRFTYLTIFALGFFTVEYVEAFVEGRVTIIRRTNRVVTPLASAVAVITTFAETSEPLIKTYNVYANWLFGVILYTAGLGVKGVVERRNFSPIIATSVGVLVFAGINDVGGDLGFLNTPRMFSLGVFVLGGTAGALLAAELLGIAAENQLLSQTLAQQNEQLSSALVKANESAKIKADFLANTSHELRTPLNAIINIPAGLLDEVGGTERWKCVSCDATQGPASACQKCGGALEAETVATLNLEPSAAKRLLKSVTTSGEHLLMLVNDILDFSKLDAERMVLHLAETDIGGLVDDVQGTIEPMAKASKVGLKLERGTGITARVDPLRLRQVLLNLLNNAVKFSDGRGEVQLSTKVVGDRLVFKVRDQGIGISAEHQTMIFEGFRQVEGGTTRRFGGTGLGLAISKRLVELHGGTLTLDSAPGAGSTFEVQLPLAGRPEEPRHVDR